MAGEMRIIFDLALCTLGKNLIIKSYMIEENHTTKVLLSDIKDLK
jgi:hypothetical protein